MKYSAGDIVTVKTEIGTTITGRVEVDEEGDYYIGLRNVTCLFLTINNMPTEGNEIIKVERQLPTRPGSVIRDVVTRSGSEFALGVLENSTNTWYLFSELGDLLTAPAESASNYFEHWEPDAT